MRVLKKLLCILMIFLILSSEFNIVNAIELRSDKQTNVTNLINDINEHIGLDCKYINIIYELLEEPDIQSDTPIKLELTNTIIQKAPFINFTTNASEYYLPDVLYSISYDILALMSQRYLYNRQDSDYFEALNKNTQLDLIFYESILIYTGEKECNVDKLLSVYPYILEGNLVENELNTIGINNDIRVNYVVNAFKYDYSLNNNMSFDNSLEYLILPYKINYTSRENLMLAAMSVVGKVRYTWGGGHGIAGIDGINPYWNIWNNTYNSDETLYKCIKPSNSWCSIHGYSDELCLEQETIYNFEQYMESREHLINSDNKYIEMFSSIDFSNGIPEHNLDGLDCSGYISWVFNQINEDFDIDTSATKFNETGCFNEIALGEKMLPGDIFAWSTHVVMIVGKVDKNNKVYVTIEQTPNQLKFGVLHYDDAKYSDIQYAKQIAYEANIIFGGIVDENEMPHVYCIDDVKYYQKENILGDTNMADEDTSLENNSDMQEDNDELIEFAFIGRYNQGYMDENTIIEDYNKKLKDMYAIEVIQYTIDNMMINYLSGYDLYESNIFNFDNV